MAKILLPKDAINAQHLRVQVTDPEDGSTPCLMTVYTGLLTVGHFTGGNPAELDIEFPLVGIVGPPFGPAVGALAILPLSASDPKSEFKAAVASAAISTFVDKTDPAIVSIGSLTADLRRVALKPNTSVNAVVLSARLKGQNSEFVTVAYHVTVLTRRPVDGPAAEPPVLVGSAIWDGTYGPIGNIQVHGVPQR